MQNPQNPHPRRTRTRVDSFRNISLALDKARMPAVSLKSTNSSKLRHFERVGQCRKSTRRKSTRVRILADPCGCGSLRILAGADPWEKINPGADPWKEYKHCKCGPYGTPFTGLVLFFYTPNPSAMHWAGMGTMAFA